MNLRYAVGRTLKPCSLGLLLLMGCARASTPEEFRERCLAHEVPRAASSGDVLADMFTGGIVGSVNESRTVADCSMLLSDEGLQKSCPALTLACTQHFAERQAAAGASKVVISSHNEVKASSPPPIPARPTFTNCVDSGYGVNCVSQ
jgi:hypothetical protein